MSEQMNGFKQMAANAEASIAAQQAGEAAAMVKTQAEANALNAQIEQGAQRAGHIDAIAERSVPRVIDEKTGEKEPMSEVQAANEAADVEVFGSRGRTNGYVDEKGKPVTEPIKGKIDEIRDADGVADRRENPRYGTKESDREVAADSYEAEQGEKADDYVADIEELQGEGFELSQAKLIHDLHQERVAKEQALFAKLSQTGKYKDMSRDEAHAAIARRIADFTRQQGNDEALIKQVVRNEGLLNRDEYNRFRFKHGRAQEGERKEFVAYHESAIASTRKQSDAAERQAIEDDLRAKDLARQQVADAEEAGRNPEIDKNSYTNVYYDADDDGRSQTAIEITGEDLGADLDALDGRRMLLTTEDTTYYLSGNYINDLEKMKGPKTDEAEEWEFAESKRRPTVRVGAPLVIDGETISGPITKIEIDSGLDDADELAKLEDWEARGEDSFQKAREILNEAYGWGKEEAETEEETTEMDKEGEAPLWFEPGGFRARIRNAMLKAHIGMQDMVGNAGGFFSDKERGDARKAVAGAGVLGALALAGAYTAAKGISLEGHVNEAAPALSMKPHHQEAAQAVGSGGTTAPLVLHEHIAHATGMGSGGTPVQTSATLKKAGQNPWAIAEHYLPPQATDARIDHYDDILRAVNGHMTEEEARNLPVGTVLNLPR